MPYYSLEKRKAYADALEQARAQSPDAGDALERAPLPPFRPNARIQAPELYQPSPELADAVNVALQLGLPLLLTGEPGSGKTQLAEHLAWFFDLGKPLAFTAQTSSTANDLFYQYDALGHFQYSQNSGELLPPDELERRFIRYRGLGEAIRRAAASKARSVVLIDEIDKAPRDLPNDVLDAMDKLRFYVAEVDKWYTAEPQYRPVIVLTSNSEKNLPDAFLRRVVYFHIEFPDEARMLDIVGSKVSGLPEEARAALTAHFYAIRADRGIRLNKYPATAELLQWAAYLQETGFRAAALRNPDRLSESERKALKASYAILAKTREDLQTLCKRLED